MYSPGIPLRDPSIDTNYVSAKLHCELIMQSRKGGALGEGVTDAPSWRKCWRSMIGTLVGSTWLSHCGYKLSAVLRLFFVDLSELLTLLVVGKLEGEPIAALYV